MNDQSKEFITWELWNYYHTFSINFRQLLFQNFNKIKIKQYQKLSLVNMIFFGLIWWIKIIRLSCHNKTIVCEVLPDINKHLSSKVPTTSNTNNSITHVPRSTISPQKIQKSICSNYLLSTPWEDQLRFLPLKEMLNSNCKI